MILLLLVVFKEVFKIFGNKSCLLFVQIQYNIVKRKYVLKYRGIDKSTVAQQTLENKHTIDPENLIKMYIIKDDYSF